MAKNKRQPYAVSEKAGHQTSAESWGTGQFHYFLQLLPVELILVFSTRSCGCTYSSCFGWRNSSCWSSCLWQSMPLRSHVRPHQSMEKVAPKDQSRAEVCSNPTTQCSTLLVYSGTKQTPLLDASQLPLRSQLPLSLPYFWPAATKSPPYPKCP